MGIKLYLGVCLTDFTALSFKKYTHADGAVLLSTFFPVVSIRWMIK